jgi:hypothetical protein
MYNYRETKKKQPRSRRSQKKAFWPSLLLCGKISSWVFNVLVLTTYRISKQHPLKTGKVDVGRRRFPRMDPVRGVAEKRFFPMAKNL